MLASKFDPSHMTKMADSTIIESDQRQEAIEIIKQVRRIDLVSDNFGMELIWSLVLADLLLSSGILKRVAFHVKKEPFAFTDATRADFFSTILDFTEFVYQLDKYSFVEVFQHDIAKLDQFWQKLSRFGDPDKSTFKITLHCDHSGTEIIRGLDLDFPEYKGAVLDIVGRYDEINTRIMAMGRRLMAYVYDERIIVDQNPHMVTSFADGTKISFEQAIVANATGMRVAKRGMFAPTVPGGTPIREAVNLYPLEAMLEGPGIVDYVVGAEPGPGVFVLGTHDHPIQKHYLNLYKLGTGPLYCFYTPYHLCHFEVPHTVARAVLFHDAAITPLGAPCVDVIAAAKTDLKAGQFLNGLGQYMTYGLCENSEVVRSRISSP